jgi:hypothetical protein
MLTAGNAGALIKGAPAQEDAMTERPKQAKVIVGCLIRGKPVTEGTVLTVVNEPRPREKFAEAEISWQEFADLVMFKNVVAYDAAAMNGATEEREAEDEGEDEPEDEPRGRTKPRTQHKRR